MDSSERYTVDTVTEELCQSFAIYWRHEDLHDAGSVPRFYCRHGGGSNMCSVM